jgi:hypothetical protein
MVEQIVVLSLDADIAQSGDQDTQANNQGAENT